MSQTPATPAKAFASQADLEDKKISFTRLSEHAYAYTAEGDPNTGIVIGDDAVMVIDTQATPAMAQDVIRRIREVTDKPIKYVMLSHYHAVRVLGASAYRPEHIIASEDTLSLIKERGEQDKASEIGRFPRLFRAVESVPPGLTWPTHHLHRQDDAVAGPARSAVAAARPRPHQGRHRGVAAVRSASCSAATWSSTTPRPMPATPISPTGRTTLDNIAALKPAKLVPGRGPALETEAQVAAGLASTRNFIADVYASVKAGAAAGKDLNTVYRETLAARAPEIRPLGDLRPLHALRRVARLSTKPPRTATRASGRPSATSRCGRRSNPEGGADAEDLHLAAL